jgi:hypothetical protein
MLKNITFSAEESAIERAREAAKANGTTLNELVRDFIENLGRPKFDEAAYHAAVEAVRNQTRGKMTRMPTRDEMNERR